MTYLCEFLRSASPVGMLFDHQLFAHGRIFYRYHGSEAARFSPAGAFRLLARLSRELGEGTTLWDPFCGTGFIPGLAAAFFAHRFPVLIASDIRAEAPRCAAANLALFLDQQALAQRLAEMELEMRPSQKHRERWGAVRDYLVRLVAGGGCRPQAGYTFQASASATPQVMDRQLLLIGDLPYGRASLLEGVRDYQSCLTPLLAAHPQAHALWIAPYAAAGIFQDLGLQLGRQVWISRFHGGRLQARMAPVGARLPGITQGVPAEESEGGGARPDVPGLAPLPSWREAAALQQDTLDASAAWA